MLLVICDFGFIRVITVLAVCDTCWMGVLIVMLVDFICSCGDFVCFLLTCTVVIFDVLVWFGFC